MSDRDLEAIGTALRQAADRRQHARRKPRRRPTLALALAATGCAAVVAFAGLVGEEAVFPSHITRPAAQKSTGLVVRVAAGARPVSYGFKSNGYAYTQSCSSASCSKGAAADFGLPSARPVCPLSPTAAARWSCHDS